MRLVMNSNPHLRRVDVIVLAVFAFKTNLCVIDRVGKKDLPGDLHLAYDGRGRSGHLFLKIGN